MSKIRFLLNIHKKNLFFLLTPTEVAFITTNCPRFYCSSNPSEPNHSSLVSTSRCGILLNYRITAFFLATLVFSNRGFTISES